jgi:EpsD family peptidyl-prolyl cis-trans isomerase
MHSVNSMQHYLAHCIWTMLVTVALSACDASASRDMSSFTVATLDGDPITLSARMQAQLARDGNAHPELLRRAADALIDEEFLYRRAIAANLDSNPQLAEAIERSRRRLLARAYAEEEVFAHVPISKQEQLDYYTQNPALFAERRIYSFTSYKLDAPLQGELLKHIRVAATVNNIERLLRSASIPFSRVEQTRAAEQLSRQTLLIFSHANVGSVLPVQSDAGYFVAVLRAIEARPLDWPVAQSVIARRLQQMRGRTTLAALLAKDRASANIAYHFNTQQTMHAETKTPDLSPSVPRSNSSLGGALP